MSPVLTFAVLAWSFNERVHISGKKEEAVT